jgi:hypothetical protein
MMSQLNGRTCEQTELLSIEVHKALTSDSAKFRRPRPSPRAESTAQRKKQLA